MVFRAECDETQCSLWGKRSRPAIWGRGTRAGQAPESLVGLLADLRFALEAFATIRMSWASGLMISGEDHSGGHGV
jgi:hypothetical protein